MCLISKRILWLISFLLIVNTVCADDNPKLVGYPPGKLMGFLGLDTKSNSPNLQDGRAIDLRNVKLSSAFDLKQRYGYSLINGTLDEIDEDVSAVTGIFDAEYSDGKSWTLVFVGDNLRYDNNGIWADISSPAITSGQNNQWLCVMALDNASCTNYVDVPIKITSTPVASNFNFTGLTNPITKAKAVIWFRNYLIWGNTKEGGTDRPTRFRWTNIGTIDTFTDDDFYDIASLSGDEIQAYVDLYGELYIIMKKSVWKASLVGGNDVFVFVKLIDGIGSVAKGSIRAISFPGNKLGVIFLSDDKKIYLFNGVTVDNIGRIIQPTLDNLNAARLQYAVSEFDGTDYYLSVSDGGIGFNDILFDYQTEILEWTKHTQIDANAIGRVKEATSVIKTYFGNYNSFVYWLNNPDNINDIDGATGIIDSIGLYDSPTMTGAQAIIDTGLTAGTYTGAIIRITSGTGQGQETVVMTHLTADTGLVVSAPFTTNPDSTSIYSIGDIDSFYQTKHYDFNDAPRYKSFRKLFLWAAEESNASIDISFTRDFGILSDSETKNLAPSSTSLWDSALWDVGTWGTTGDKFYTSDLKGLGRNVSIKFSQDDIDKTFHLYGYHILADIGDVE